MFLMSEHPMPIQNEKRLVLSDVLSAGRGDQAISKKLILAVRETREPGCRQ